MSAGVATIGRLGMRLGLLLLVVSACGSEPEPSRPRGMPKPAGAKRPVERPTPGMLEEPTPGALLERTRARLRLTPDERFLAALSRLDGFVGEARSATPTVRFDAGRWQLRIGQYDVGVLPELPGFADQYAMLLARATRLWTQHGKELPRLAEPDGGAPIAADPPVPTLQRIEGSWRKGERSREDACSAAQAYAALCLGMVDELGVADAFVAQALAATAFAEVVSGQPLTREKALLAWTMGYAQSALAIAAKLPADDAVRRFVAGEVDPLVAAARDAPEDEMAGMLALRGLAARPAREVEAFLARAPDALKASLPALAATARSSWRPHGEWRMAFSALVALREQLGREVKPHAGLTGRAESQRQDAELLAEAAAANGLTFEQALPEAEQMLDKLAAKPGGAWLPTDALVAYHRAQLFSGFDALVRYQAESPDSPEQAKQVVAMLAAGKGPLAQQLARYGKDLARADQRSLPLEELVKDIRELKDLGLGALERLWVPLDGQAGDGAAWQQAASAIGERCDSRIRCRALLTTIAHRDLQDPVTDEKLRASVVAEAPVQYSSLRLRHLRMERDRSGFLAAVAERGVATALRAESLRQASQWLDARDLRSAFDALVAQAPTSFGVREAYATWLIEQKDYKRAVKTLDEWIRLKWSDHPLEPAAAQTLRARALQQSGKFAEAWAGLEPQLSSTYAAAPMRGAQVRLAAGKPKEALALAQTCLERHPGPAAVGVLAELLWKTGQHAEAAALLEQWSSKLASVDWSQTLAGAFAAAFADQPAEQGAKAYAELLAKKVDAQGVRALIRRELLPAELAFSAYSQLKGAGPERHLDVATGYLMLKDWKGESEARTWLEQALPADQRDPLSQAAYTVAAYDLIWDVVADPKPDNPQRAMIWLMRTAAYLRSQALPEAWKKRIDQYYAKHREELRDRMGLHLLGQSDQVGVWTAIKDDRDRPECTYVFGLKAQLDGDIAQAIEWYRITIEGGRGHADAWQWASDALGALRASDKSIALLTAEAKAKQPVQPATAAKTD